VASFFEELAKKLGMRPPPKPREIPALLDEGQFGPHKGQPGAALGVPTFDVLGLGLVDPELKRARERIVANTRKIIGEAQRAYDYARAIQAPLLAVERQAFQQPPETLPPPPEPVPRSAVLAQLREVERREEQHRRTFGIKAAAAQRAGAEQSRAITAAGGEAAYAAQLQAQQRATESAATAKAEWEALARAGDPAGKAWVAWQQALAKTTFADAQLRAQQAHGKTAEARAQIPALQSAYNAAKAASDALEAGFRELKRARDRWIARKQKSAGTHPLEQKIAELEAKRTDPTRDFTVSDNVALINYRKQLEAI